MTRALRGIQVLTSKKVMNMLPFQLAVGQITKAIDGNTREVKVLKMELNDYLKMYFNKSYEFQSVDYSGESKKGDIVLVQRMENPPTQTKLFEVQKILFKIDDIVDPVTGKKVSHEDEILKQHIDSLTKAFSTSK